MGKFSCGHVLHTTDCKCYCSNTGSRHIWVRAERHAEALSLGMTSAGCKCQADWTYKGNTYNGCQSPKSSPHALIDTNTNLGDKHASWCKIVPGTCTQQRSGLSNAVRAGADWDTCEAHTHVKLQIP